MTFSFSLRVIFWGTSLQPQSTPETCVLRFFYSLKHSWIQINLSMHYSVELISRNRYYQDHDYHAVKIQRYHNSSHKRWTSFFVWVLIEFSALSKIVIDLYSIKESKWIGDYTWGGSCYLCVRVGVTLVTPHSQSYSQTLELADTNTQTHR